MLIQLSDSLVPPNLRGPVLVDDSGIPRYWAAVWSTMHGSHLAASTHLKKLRHIESLYKHAEQLPGAILLDETLGHVNDDALASVLESWFVSIRNKSRTSEYDEKRWQTGLEFVLSVVTWVSKNQASQISKRIEARLYHLSLLYRQLHVSRSRSSESIRSLPATTVKALYDALDPSSDKNPFHRIATRWRIYVCFILMLHQGLRRGEVLSLPVDAVKTARDPRRGEIRYWINIQENPYEEPGIDVRHSKPSVKNSVSIRQIPVSELTAAIVETYAQNYRGRAQHSFLLSSQSNQPLSTEALTKAFALVSKSLSKSVLAELKDRTGKASVTPHDLRHTCAVIRLQQLLMQGDSVEEALQKLRTFFGWSRTSSMPTRYSRAVFEDRLATVWNDAFDDRVSLLRSIPGSE